MKTKKQAPTKSNDFIVGLDPEERNRIHRTINWVVSVLLIAFAIWSINLNAEGRAMLKETSTLIIATDMKIVEIVNELKVVKNLCEPKVVIDVPQVLEVE